MRVSIVPVGAPSASIRTGSSGIGGAFGVRLSVHDARSFELSWGRVPGAATYRLSCSGQVVQDDGGVSRYVSDLDELIAGTDPFTADGPSIG